MKLATAQVCNWRSFKDKEGWLWLDATRKTGDLRLAPSWNMVSAIKKQQISESDYTREFYHLMMESIKANRDYWLNLAKEDSVVVIACYCPPGDFCHRLLLADIFHRLCVKAGLPFKYIGEIKEPIQGS